jgi:hypothetical protein
MNMTCTNIYLFWIREGACSKLGAGYDAAAE